MLLRERLRTSTLHPVPPHLWPGEAMAYNPRR